MSRWLERMAPHMIFCLTTCLVLFGLVMVYSSSAFRDYRKTSQKAWELAVDQAVLGVARNGNEDGQAAASGSTLEVLRRQDATRRASMLSTFLKQLCWVLIGFLALAATATVDYPLWGKRIGLVLLVVLFLQAALFIIPANTGWPVQSKLVNGSRSWLEILAFRIQPSEIAKLGLVIFSAWYLARRIEKNKLTFFSFIPALPVFALSIGLILCESDKGVAVHLCLALIVLWLLAAGRFSHVLVLGLLACIAVGAMIAGSPEARSRITGFIGSDSFQLRHSKEAFARGGMFGTGLGDGDAALSQYLYGSHTDFIMAVVGEELGFMVTAALVTGYLTLVLFGLRVASECADPFGTLLALGITTLIGTQAFLNMAIATGLAPTTGFTLPLLSYGGSSLTWTMISIGILINVSLSTHNRLLRDRNRQKPSPFGGGRTIA
jgi:cell division protein FtsW